MSSGIYVAAAGAVAQSNALDTTANNIANASTTGFRGDNVTFREALTGARSADITLVDHGSSTSNTAAGAQIETNNPLDVAISGDGYFGVQTATGPRYTRAGNFQLDTSHRLVNQDGQAVRGQGGAPITIPDGATNVAIDANGNVSADGATVGQLELTKFAPSQLKREGATLYVASGAPQAGGAPVSVRSGTLEQSNVNVVRGVVDLVKTSRTYESLMQVIQGYHDVEDRAARELGAPK